MSPSSLQTTHSLIFVKLTHNNLIETTLDLPRCQLVYFETKCFLNTTNKGQNGAALCLKMFVHTKNVRLWGVGSTKLTITASFSVIQKEEQETAGTLHCFDQTSIHFTSTTISS